MGLFDKVFSKPSVNVVSDNGYWKTLTAYSPSFTSRAGSAYESELVRAAIDARARHIAKLNIEVDGARANFTKRIVKAPNSFQTWYQFLYRLSTILDMQNTAFIIPLFDEYGDINGFYPILPTSAAIVDVKGEPWLRYKFMHGQNAAIEMKRCGIITKYQYKDDFFGETSAALNNTLDLIDLQNQAIKEAIKNGATFRFMARFNNLSKASDLAKERERFNENNFKAEKGGGLLLFPNTYEDIKQINSSSYVVDNSQMNLIRTNVFNYFGVNEDVLQNKALGDVLDAFFNGVIEPFAIQLSEVMTSMVRVNTGNNNVEIIIAANRLQYMSVREKVSLAQQMGDRGALMIDEMRALFNYPPLPDGAGQKAPIRGEYYFSTDEEGKNDANEE